MLSKTFKLFTSILSIAVFMLLLKSCKKIDSNTLNQNESEYMNRVRAKVKSQVDIDGGIPQIVNINKRYL